MTLKEKLVAAGFAEEHVPGGYQLVGDIVLVKFPIGAKIDAAEKKVLAEAISGFLPNARVIAEIKRVSGELRKPQVVVLLSKGKKSLETIHVENGIKFKLDTRKIMFSKGNMAERARLALKIRPEEIIIDMFAGIGYFSLGLAKNTAAAKIFAIEKNPVAFKYLKQNIKLNDVTNIVPMRADCRRARVDERADRVLMGYFPDTQKFLPYAFRFLKERGVIHYHNVYREEEMNEKPVAEIKQAAKRAGYCVLSLAHHIVKSYAPHTFHVVVDVEVEKNEQD